VAGQELDEQIRRDVLGLGSRGRWRLGRGVPNSASGSDGLGQVLRGDASFAQEERGADALLQLPHIERPEIGKEQPDRVIAEDGRRPLTEHPPDESGQENAEKDAHPAASDIEVQEGLLSACERLTGIALAAGRADESMTT
jgi:hypothetical protein